MQQLPVTHINAADYPAIQDSGAIASWMALKYLANGSDSHISTTENPGSVLYEYGKTLQETGDFTPDTVSGMLNQFRIDSGYNYAVVHGAAFDDILDQIASAMSRDIPNVSPYPSHTPALIPLGGTLNRWVVITGTVSNGDPALSPTTTIRGIWIDDPAIYNDPMFPIETNLFYSAEVGIPNGLDQFYLAQMVSPYAGEWVAIVAVPEPTTYGSLLAGLGLLGFVARRRKQKHSLA